MLKEETFARLGLACEPTPEEAILVYTMDFPNCYIEVTDELGRTPVDEKSPLILACYDEAGAFLWFCEYPDFAALQQVMASHDPGSPSLLAALQEASQGSQPLEDA